MKAINYASLIFFAVLLMLLVLTDIASADVNYVRITSERKIKVMVIDTGVNIKHMAFQGKTVHCVTPAACEDPIGHGSGVASLVLNGELALRNNKLAKLLPICDRVEITSCRVFGPVYSMSSFESCMKTAIGQDFDYINYSLNGDDFLKLEYTLMAAFGGTVVTAAGNEGRDLAKEPTFPAMFNQLFLFPKYKQYKTLKNIVSVGALTRENTRWISSNYGPVSAWRLGAGVITAGADGKIVRTSGTSFAAPLYLNELLAKRCAL